MTTAKLFWNGSSQAVRLPKEFRFAGKEVKIRRQGKQVIIEPIAEDWEWLDSLDVDDPSWAQAVQALHEEAPQERDWSALE